MTIINKEDIKAVLAGFSQPSWEHQNPQQEIYYDWYVSPRTPRSPKLAIRWYTSVLPNGTSRPVGEDSIRIVVIRYPRMKTERLLYSSPRIQRTPGWEHRVQQRLRDMWYLLRGSPECPACRDYMLPKTEFRSGRPFLSCVRFPACRGARSVPEKATFAALVYAAKTRYRKGRNGCR